MERNKVDSKLFFKFSFFDHRTLSSVALAELTCNTTAQKCPKNGCSCHFIPHKKESVVDCKRLALKDLPKGIELEDGKEN